MCILCGGPCRSTSGDQICLQCAKAKRLAKAREIDELHGLCKVCKSPNHEAGPNCPLYE